MPVVNRSKLWTLSMILSFNLGLLCHPLHSNKLWLHSQLNSHPSTANIFINNNNSCLLYFTSPLHTTVEFVLWHFDFKYNQPYNFYSGKVFKRSLLNLVHIPAKSGNDLIYFWERTISKLTMNIGTKCNIYHKDNPWPVSKWDRWTMNIGTKFNIYH